MDYALDRFEQEIRAALTAAKVPAAQIELATPKANIPADLAFPVFRAARELGVAPPKLAQELAAAVRFGEDSLVGGVAVAGPYLNFTLDPARLAAAVLGEVERSGDR